ncbi:gliding motility-associated ABC transporter substrate-binding protein GldG [Mangrovimonas sp. AS39]|uniref:gliding motility-associated ABC transporter substrate-binding protein GldG n=1 Tax=Mangrovimonas futianensis TaxID=2895523 RepID=UPI001E4B5CC6|nr:gliding motility-associated ABC transporter substrate-binding protein GldG [Mangrovimonas futianensis]MCF1192724.1 gliding motility-associated ABC transporter substrate-binding protein GldG [Mangrovimonas futianensis]MCF1196355.1 gliding motility-associated ABC transporter substrate-binding protein GldG [Mangrovimonas futianensis]
MFALFRKEINSFFASPIGYLVIAVFLLLNGLFLWLFKGEFNVLDNGFADLSSFFLLAPWILLFLVPAVTMRCFSDEKKQGTLELLLTKPISHLQIVLGKYLGSFVLIILALIPTLLYIYTVYELGLPTGNLDMGSTLGSYFGLLFLVAAYTAIGVFASTLSENQIVSFIIAVFLCFFFYIGFEGVAEFSSSTLIEKFGMSYHFKSMGRGVLDTRDIVYFLFIALLFIALTTLKINNRRIGKNDSKIFIVLGLGLVVLIFTQSVYKRFDLTADQRYTLNPATVKMIEEVNSPVVIDVFLEGESFPSEFRRLQDETKQLLEEFEAKNGLITFNFINPIEDEKNRQNNIQQLNARGMTPMQLSVEEQGKSSYEVVFPWALASYNEETVIIPLIKNKMGATQQDLVTNSVQHLEYGFADGLNKLIHPKSKKIAILKGNGQLGDGYIFDFVKTIKDYYYIAPFTLDSVSRNPEKTLRDLKNYDLIISAKPIEPFTEEEKFVLDQYTMNGGKSLWMFDAVNMEMDSLFQTGKGYAIQRDLNMTDFFFKYGVRVNPDLVNDLYSAPILLATGEGSEARFQPFPWFYSPLVDPENHHPIVKNINRVKFDFASPIDTLKNDIHKTILLKSSILSKLDGVPREIDLSMTTEEPDPKMYTKPNLNLAVLLEGSFTSVYNNRIKPFDLQDSQDKGVSSKMIIVGDGDIIKNDLGKNGPLELGFDRSSGQLYGNKEFLLNCVNYLLDDSGLINIRSKDIKMAFLDMNKVSEEKTKWQLINIVCPLVLLGIFGMVFNYLRKKKYAA